MREKDNPIVKIILAGGKIVFMHLQDAIEAGLIDEETPGIQDKQRLPSNNKTRKLIRERRQP